MACLEKNFKLEVQIEEWNGQCNLSIPSRNEAFQRLKIHPIVKAEIPSMLYKLE